MLSVAATRNSSNFFCWKALSLYVCREAACAGATAIAACTVAWTAATASADSGITAARAVGAVSAEAVAATAAATVAATASATVGALVDASARGTGSGVPSCCATIAVTTFFVAAFGPTFAAAALVPFVATAGVAFEATALAAFGRGRGGILGSKRWTFGGGGDAADEEEVELSSPRVDVEEVSESDDAEGFRFERDRCRR